MSNESLLNYVAGELSNGWESSLNGSGELDLQRLSEAEVAGDALAHAAFLRLGRYLGVGLTTMVNLFNPAVVIPAVTHGWTLTDAATICAARDAGAVGQLRRILGDEPDGLARANELLAHATAALPLPSLRMVSTRPRMRSTSRQASWW